MSYMHLESWENIKKKKNELLQKEFIFFSDKIDKMRSNRISLESIKGMTIDQQKKKIPIKQVCSLTIDSNYNQLVIKPDNNNYLSLVVKLILNSNLGLKLVNNISNVKNEARFALEIITEEKKNNILKDIKLCVEQFKIATRRIRDDFRNTLKKDKTISQSQKQIQEKQIDELIDDYQNRIFSVEKKKITELKKH